MTEQTDPGHTTVLLQEAIDGLDIKPGDIFVDGTLGSGGHSSEVAKRFGTTVKIIGLDIDEDALSRSRSRLESLHSSVILVQANFRNLDAVLDGLQISQVQKIVLDLGLSSNQIEQSGRGFSFKNNESLRMTFKKNPEGDDITAETIVNEWSEETLELILRGYGEEWYAKRIASEIVKARVHAPITTTFELVDIILKATPSAYHHRRIHPATKTFQALRIATNDELTALDDILKKGFERLATEGRMAVISFHSLEDRKVKKFFKERSNLSEAIIITKRPIVPQASEITANRRSRSAKLRIIMKL